jgi:membrane-associated phospholipid phosphatase
MLLLLGLAFAADVPLREFVTTKSTAEQRSVADVLSRYGKAEEFIAICAVGWIVGRRCRRRDWQRRWALVLVATLVAGVAVNVPRSLTGRARPNHTVEQGWFGPRHHGEWLVGRYQYSSFPSGHTTTAAGFAVAALLCFRRLGALALVLPVVIGWARIWLSAHHFSDVAIGMVFGGVLAWCVWRWLSDRGWLAVENAPSESGATGAAGHCPRSAGL